MGDTAGTRPLFSSFADDPALGPAIQEFVLGLAGHASKSGFEPVASCASGIETTSLAQQLEPTYRALVELTDLARCVRLGHRGAA